MATDEVDFDERSQCQDCHCGIQADDGHEWLDGIPLCWSCLSSRHDHLRDEVQSVLIQLDELATLWGDEGVFRRCRDRLRVALSPEPREPEGG